MTIRFSKLPAIIAQTIRGNNVRVRSAVPAGQRMYTIHSRGDAKYADAARRFADEQGWLAYRFVGAKLPPSYGTGFSFVGIPVRSKSARTTSHHRRETMSMSNTTSPIDVDSQETIDEFPGEPTLDGTRLRHAFKKGDSLIVTFEDDGHKTPATVMEIAENNRTLTLELSGGLGVTVFLCANGTWQEVTSHAKLKLEPVLAPDTAPRTP